MGVPARRREATPAAVGPHLRVVKPPRQDAASAKRRVRPHAARRNFRAFCLLTIVLGALGMGRVWLSVQATEASIESNRLREDIKAERYEGDMLEVRQSALGSPSRIRRLAGSAMNMAPAGKVTYLDLSEDGRKTDEDPGRRATGSRLKRALASVLDLTAGEAQVLLVGDVGLASGH